jgi:hypothetical protein
MDTRVRMPGLPLRIKDLMREEPTKGVRNRPTLHDHIPGLADAPIDLWRFP